MTTNQNPPPQSNVGPDYSSHRGTFTIPPGHEAVRDENGRATGEVRPISPAPVQHVVPTEANNLIREAIPHIQEQRDDLFAGHSIQGKLVVLDATDAIAAQAISDLDNWILRAKAFVAEVSTDA